MRPENCCISSGKVIFHVFLSRVQRASSWWSGRPDDKLWPASIYGLGIYFICMQVSVNGSCKFRREPLLPKHSLYSPNLRD